VHPLANRECAYSPQANLREPGLSNYVYIHSENEFSQENRSI
jgi:hypothetical protein